MSIETVGEVAVITFGIVGAVVVGHKAQTMVKKHGGGAADQLIAGTVASGLVAAIPPVAVATGIVAAGAGAAYAVQHRKEAGRLVSEFFDTQKRRAAEAYSRVRRNSESDAVLSAAE